METASNTTTFTSFQRLCVGASVCCAGAGALGMALSFFYLASSSLADIRAGTAGFLAGAILIVGGVIALALLSTGDRRSLPEAPVQRAAPRAKSRVGRILLIIAGISVMGVGALSWLGYELLSPNSSWNRASAIDTIYTWGRLAPFPNSAQGFTLSTTGNMFTRGFRVSFTAPPADIEQWLQQSPGTNGTTPSTEKPGIRHYEIRPGGGAQWAEVEVDDVHHRVSIYVYWS